MNILIIHQNFPGQFRHIAQHLVQTGHNVIGIGAKQAPGMRGIQLVRYEIKKAPQPGHAFLGTVTTGATHGEVVARLCIELKNKGFTPDAILCHPGWGEALYLKDVFPDVRRCRCSSSTTTPAAWTWASSPAARPPSSWPPP